MAWPRATYDPQCATGTATSGSCPIKDSRGFDLPWGASAAAYPRISEFRAGGKLELLSEFGETQAGPVRLESDQSSVEIDFLAVSHRAPWRLLYQYRLEGAEGASWSEPAATHSVRFPNLAPAAYRFEVRSIGEAGQLSPPAFVAFRLLPPIWRRGWFLSALLILTAAAGYALHRYRLNQLLAVERVRTRLATDLHDDLGAGLAEIAILSEVARRQPAHGAAEALEYTAARARGLRAAWVISSDRRPNSRPSRRPDPPYAGNCPDDARGREPECSVCGAF